MLWTRFNVLNNIYSLANQGSDRTAATVMQLSQLLRYITYQGQQAAVSLEEEVRQLRRYIALFQLRGLASDNIDLEVIGDPYSWEIEPLLLLPLVENAFKHGNLVTSKSAYAKFTLVCSTDHLHFTAENSYDPQETQKDEESGVGLDNIRQRVLLTYGTAAEVRISTFSEGLFECQLILPKP
ncbi:MAG: sensor histidine kinase [Bacteroidota bacterium]